MTKSDVYTVPDSSEYLYDFIFYHRSRQNITVTDKICDKSILRFIVNVLRRTDLLDIALIHNNDRIRHCKRFFLIVSNVNKGDAEFVFQTDQFVLHILAKLQIKSSERFV
jgi:hypothetical protein